MTTNQTIDTLIKAETDSTRAADARRVLSDERQALQAAVQGLENARRKAAAVSKHAPSHEHTRAAEAVRASEERLAARHAEARRVAGMWGVRA